VLRCILPVEVGVPFLLYPEAAQIPVQNRLDSVAGKGASSALHPTPVEYDDRAAGLGQINERLHVATEAGNARHLRDLGAIHPDSEMVGKLCGARTAGAGVNQRLVVWSSHGGWSTDLSRQGMPRRNGRRGVFDLHPPRASNDNHRDLKEKRGSEGPETGSGCCHG